ncbi:unnamed protein product [Lactuca virosa]|uniref:Uncharacterized protein n=1 Tax=Lactuca virosa TaxID=75947 RepID=A0AAU9NXC5_9ASTR|nr:unnamed protein product [Lactuca virosa]
MIILPATFELIVDRWMASKTRTDIGWILLQITLLPANGCMLFSGESCLESTLLPSGIMKEVFLIEQKETNVTGFLFGKMGFVILMNVSELGTTMDS